MEQVPQGQLPQGSRISDRDLLCPGCEPVPQEGI